MPEATSPAPPPDSDSSKRSGLLTDNPWIPYVAPMFVFLALTQAEVLLPQTSDGGPHPTWYPVAYALKVLIVAVVMWICRSAWRDLRPWPNLKGLALSIGIGLAVIAAWIGLDNRYPPLPFLGGDRQAFDPFVLPMAGAIAFLTVRIIGLVLLVPVFEELFWRSFLMRWVIDSEFTRVPIGRVTTLAAAVSSIGFALAHPEWLPALLTGMAWAWLLWKTKSVSACVISHLTANLALALYVLITSDWKFW
ncbi:CAAX prenyl protease-related protein [soil metagenome]